MTNIDILAKAEELDATLKIARLFSLGLNVRYVLNSQMLLTLERFAIYHDTKDDLTPQLFGVPFRIDPDAKELIKAEVW